MGVGGWGVGGEGLGFGIWVWGGDSRFSFQASKLMVYGLRSRIWDPEPIPTIDGIVFFRQRALGT